MSDGPVKPTLEVEPEPLDDIILGEDEEDISAKPAAKPAAPPQAKQPSRSPPPPPVKAAGSIPPKGADAGAGATPDQPSKPPPPKKAPSSDEMKVSDSGTDTKKRA